MSHLRASALAVGLAAATTLAACDREHPTSPVAPIDAPRAIVVTPSLFDALRDARERTLPTVDDALRAPLGSALQELDAALVAGQATRSRHAIAAVRALLAEHEADGDAADLASVGVLLAVADTEVGSGAR